MNVIRYPERNSWDELLKRPAQNNISVINRVKDIIASVKKDRDTAVKNYSLQFDGFAPDSFLVTDEEINNAVLSVSADLKEAINLAADNIRKYHRAQLKTVSQIIETTNGVHCWNKNVAIENVGLYIPGGTAPLFSTVLMLGIPAMIAGCKEIILCTPANKEGKINPTILYTAKLIGISKVYRIGGAQAIAAMAYGTETVPKVYKIFGPGNQYVTAAKQLVQSEGVAIDMPAGPSELCIIADETAKPEFIATDLLSQAEHGVDSQVILITTSEVLIIEVLSKIQEQIESLTRKQIVSAALLNSKAILVNDITEAIELSNSYAPEHLIIACKDEETIAEKITNAGSVFIGNYSPESAGDYASGTNHTLPTSGYAKAYSGVSVDSFMKKISFQKLSKQGLQNIGKAVIHMAEAEGLQAHAQAVKIRIQNEANV